MSYLESHSRSRRRVREKRETLVAVSKCEEAFVVVCLWFCPLGLCTSLHICIVNKDSHLLCSSDILRFANCVSCPSVSRQNLEEKFRTRTLGCYCNYVGAVTLHSAVCSSKRERNNTDLQLPHKEIVCVCGKSWLFPRLAIKEDTSIRL